MRVGKDSQKITPDFAYDNGIFTYVGFSTLKTFPSAFLYHNGKEQSLNFSVETKGKYKVMVIHNVNDKFVLRYGNQVVGVVNQSFGDVKVAPRTTLSPTVERVEVKK
jgi:type IV secretion system protein VirB9